MHMFPFTPLINDLNQLSFYLYNQYNYITSINNSPTHHYTNELSQLFFISWSNHSSSHPRQENIVFIHIWSIPSWIHLWLQNKAFYITYYMTSASIIHKPCLTNYKKPCALYSLITTVHIIYIPIIQHTDVPPIMHNILSINLHTSTNHLIKTHHNSKTS